MTVKFKKLDSKAATPLYAKEGDAGLDLVVTSVDSMMHETVRYNFGIAVEIPEGYVGLIFPRSSIYKHSLHLTNSVGVIDSGYRGELGVVMRGLTSKPYKVGDRAAQLLIIPYPKIEFEEVDKLSESERGANGYGSTGR